MDRSDLASRAVNDIFEREDLVHYGVKGMKWGVRREDRPGAGHPASEDATRAKELTVRGRGSGRDSLSNRELQDLVQRWNLEQQYDRLRPRSKREQVGRFVAEQLLKIGKEQATAIAREQIADAIKKAGQKQS